MISSETYRSHQERSSQTQQIFRCGGTQPAVALMHPPVETTRIDHLKAARPSEVSPVLTGVGVSEKALSFQVAEIIPSGDVSSQEWRDLFNRGRFPQFKRTCLRITEVDFEKVPPISNLAFTSSNTESMTRREETDVFDNIYEYHNKFHNTLNNLIDPQKQVRLPDLYTYPYDTMAEIITRYSAKLCDVPDNALNIFFDYTDLLEALLLVITRRGIVILDVRDILIRFKNIYEKIYPTLINPVHEDYSVIRIELSRIREQMENIGLMPTMEEYHDEISENIKKMNETEMKELATIFKVP
ncbi:MAG TPA: hypothetical protein HA349_03235 [Methanotrichaceae archaeon]|nr:hypothetical protein [Methanotrichaceae archaeon]